MAARINLRTRRFLCDAPAYPRRIFAERLPAVAPPYARRPLRLTETLQELAPPSAASRGPG